MAELDKHNVHAVVMLYGRSKHWSPAGWPQVTVPLGYLPEDAAIVADTGTDACGQTFEVPSKPLKSHPNRSAFNLVRLQHEHTADCFPAFLSNRPYGITFASSGFKEDLLVKIAYAFEQATHARREARTYPEATPKTQLKDVIKTVVR